MFHGGRLRNDWEMKINPNKVKAEPEQVKSSQSFPPPTFIFHHFIAMSTRGDVFIDRCTVLHSDLDLGLNDCARDLTRSICIGTLFILQKLLLFDFNK